MPYLLFICQQLFTFILNYFISHCCTLIYNYNYFNLFNSLSVFIK